MLSERRTLCTMSGHGRSSDKAKLDYLRQWLQYIVEDKCTALPANFTPGLQLVNLPPEVKDGFLTLIVPMIKSRQDLQVKVRDIDRANHVQHAVHVLVPVTVYMKPDLAAHVYGHAGVQSTKWPAASGQGRRRGRRRGGHSLLRPANPHPEHEQEAQRGPVREWGAADAAQPAARPKEDLVLLPLLLLRRPHQWRAKALHGDALCTIADARNHH